MGHVRRIARVGLPSRVRKQHDLFNDLGRRGQSSRTPGCHKRGSLINCTFADNDITAEDTLNAADFRVGSGNDSFNVVNCVFDESASGHLNAASPATMIILR